MPSISDTTSSVESTPSPTDDDLSESSVASSHSFVSEVVVPSLPADGPVSLGDVATACDGCPHDDLVWLPGLLVMTADLTIARVSTARRPTTPSDGDAPPHVGEHLACAACIIKSLLEIVVKLRKKQEAPQRTQEDSQQALICGHDDILQAALHLRSEVYHVAVRHRISVPVCAWERSIPGRPSKDAVVRRTGIHWAGDGKRGATKFPEACDTPAPVTAVLQKLRRATAAQAGAQPRSAAPPTPSTGSPTHHVSPRVRRDLSSVLPCELSEGPITSGRAPLQALRGIKFSWPLPPNVRALFDAKKWKAHVFARAAHAAARRIAGALGELAELSAPDRATLHGGVGHALDGASQPKRSKRSRSSPGGTERRAKAPEMTSTKVERASRSASQQTEARGAKKKKKLSVKRSRSTDPSGSDARLTAHVAFVKEVNAKLAAHDADLKEMRANINALTNSRKVHALVAKVNAAKTTYCDALLKTICCPMPLPKLLRAVFIESRKRGQDEPAVGRPNVHVSGRCPLRAALLAGWAASTGEVRPCPECKKVGQCVIKGGSTLCDQKGSCPTIERMAHIIPDAAAKYQETLIRRGNTAHCLASFSCNGKGSSPTTERMAHIIPDAAAKYQETLIRRGNTAHCFASFSCNGKGSCPTIERRAHIIPDAAPKLSETVQLLDRFDGASMRCGRDMARSLASAHNLFCLSSCFEECFDNGTLVLVKVGPPELQCYQVTSTPSTTGTQVAFGEDLQMRDLLSPAQAPVLLSCIDGLVVNLARPIKVTSRDGVEHDVPRVSQRYLELHAQAHLVDARRPLSAEVLQHVEAGNDECGEDSDDEIEAWLDEVGSLPGQPDES